MCKGNQLFFDTGYLCVSHPPHPRSVCHTPNPNDMAEADKCLHKLSHAVCMIDAIAIGIAAILDYMRTVAGADIDAWLHVVILGQVDRKSVV